MALAWDAARIIRSLAPTKDTIASLAEVGRLLARAGEPHRAAEVAEEAGGLARDLADTRPSALTLSRLVTGLSQAGQLQHAAPTARSLRDPTARADVLAFTAEAGARSGDLAAAVALAAEAVEAAGAAHGSAADDAAVVFSDLRADALAEVAQALARSGDLEHAVELAGAVVRYVREDSGLSLQALTGVVQALAEAGRTGEALDLAAALTGSETRADALARVAVAMARPDLPRARQLAAEAALLVFEDDHPLGQALALGRVVRSLAGLREQRYGSCELAHIAVDVALSVTEPSTDPQLIAEVSEALVRAGDARHGVELAVDYADSVEEGTDPELHAAALAHAACTLALAGETGPAVAWATLAAGEARALRHASERADVLFNAATALMRSDEAARAAELAADIPDMDLRSTALAHASHGLIGNGDLPQAVEVARDIRDPATRAAALAGIAGTLGGAGRHELCLTYLSEAAEHARTVTDQHQRETLLADIACASPDEHTGRALLAEVLSSGAWDRALPAMAQVAPETLRIIASLLAEPGMPSATR